MLIEFNSDHQGVSDRAVPPSGTRLLHRLFTGHVGQRRPLSSRPTSLQASLGERAGALKNKGLLRIPRYFIDGASSCGAAEAGGKAATEGTLHITNGSYSRSADCGLPCFELGVLPVLMR
jgi:hypothetical protein